MILCHSHYFCNANRKKKIVVDYHASEDRTWIHPGRLLMPLGLLSSFLVPFKAGSFVHRLKEVQLHEIIHHLRSLMFLVLTVISVSSRATNFLCWIFSKSCSAKQQPYLLLPVRYPQLMLTINPAH